MKGDNTNTTMKTITLVMLLAVFALAVVSAEDLSAAGKGHWNSWQCGSDSTIIGGTVTDANNGNAPVAGADVVVTCNENVEEATTDASGHYSVQFDGTECGQNDVVTVEASKDDMSGSNEDLVNDGQYTLGGKKRCGCTVNIGIVDVPLIPEFGLMVGSLTIVGALVALFAIRRH